MKTSIPTKAYSILTVLVIASAFSGGFALNAGSMRETSRSSIISWWSADATGRDSGHNNNGLLKNGAGYLPGVRGMAFNFNRCAGNYVLARHDDSLGFGSSDFTIETWVNFRSCNISYDYDRPDTIFLGVDEGPGETSKWFFGFHAGKLTFHINSPTLGPKWALDTTFTPDLDKWYNLALTRQDGVFKVYVNGELVGTDSNLANISIPNPSAPLTIGQAEGIGFIDGMMDETQIFNRALSASQIQGIYTLYNK
jgi:hypothetical protein